MNILEKESLIQEIDDLLDEMVTIRVQLDFAKSEAKVNGGYSDIDWFNKAKHALAIKGRQHQKLQRKLAEANKIEKQNLRNRADRRFMNAARKILADQTFRDILESSEGELGD